MMKYTIFCDCILKIILPFVYIERQCMESSGPFICLEYNNLIVNFKTSGKYLHYIAGKPKRFNSGLLKHYNTDCMWKKIINIGLLNIIKNRLKAIQSCGNNYAFVVSHLYNDPFHYCTLWSGIEYIPLPSEMFTFEKKMHTQKKKTYFDLPSIMNLQKATVLV